MTSQQALKRIGTMPLVKPFGARQAISAVLDQDAYRCPGWERTPDARVVLHHVSKVLEAQAKVR